MSKTPELDHVIVLLPYQDITHPPAWLTDNFVVSSGGRHSDGKTENRLVLFSDGTYLELIAFVNDDSEKRRGHWWDKPFGIVDFALTTGDEFRYEALKERLSKTGTGVSYSQPREGGRLTPDGQELKWKVTFPTGADRGDVPFWCHDVTPRERRVPITDASTKHPCGAIGLAGVRLEVDQGKLKVLQKATAAIVHSVPDENGSYEVGTPRKLQGVPVPHIQLQECKEAKRTDSTLSLVLRAEGHPTAIDQTVGDGVVSIHFEQ